MREVIPELTSEREERVTLLVNFYIGVRENGYYLVLKVMQGDDVIDKSTVFCGV